mmetsp:Transcript_4007/g.5815  ORF Transcript_4007/g.5815 Transcript_4007/m.5815 type:complete len:406 (+) Transcript_4007:81-1298(+)
MSREFDEEEWKLIFQELEENPLRYGFPNRVQGSALIGSFNIRKLGSAANRSVNTWKFLGLICNCFDLLAIQEALDNMDGINRLKEEVGDDWKIISSDKTGTYPGDSGVGERLVFFYRSSTVERGEVVSDITYDRSKVTEILFENLDEINEAKAKYDADMEDYTTGKRKTKPSLNPPTFLSFIRSPYCASFKVKGNNPAYVPYTFMAINAHLIYGTTKDRWREFEALMNWIRNRVVQREKTYYPSFMLLGDLNLDYDDPAKDYSKMEQYMKNINVDTPDEVHVNFPFLDVHPKQTEHFTSNVKLTQRYDQIGLFFRDDDGVGKGFPTHSENKLMGTDDGVGHDYGVFNFTELFSKALTKKSFKELSKDEGRKFVRKYEHEVSDHMPLWIRLKFIETSNKRKFEEVN